MSLATLAIISLIAAKPLQTGLSKEGEMTPERHKVVLDGLLSARSRPMGRNPP
ncbi:MAG TPA: hypothetical protein VMI31_03605 [Fimbriimonadaceae bacterium]|nr:hypothetical protein [Fimbriimonadaceae bacterium]